MRRLDSSLRRCGNGRRGRDDKPYTYPIDWDNTPNSAAHASIVISQLQGMRQYLNTIPEYVDTPIWITEIALHIGYDGWHWVHKATANVCDSTQIITGECRLAPRGIYHWDNMSDYLIAVLDWLDVNGPSYKIEKWFFFVTWKDIVDVGGDGYMGIIFFDGPNQGDPINCLGEVYRARSLGLPHVACDANGNTVTRN